MLLCVTETSHYLYNAVQLSVYVCCSHEHKWIWLPASHFSQSLFAIWSCSVPVYLCVCDSLGSCSTAAITHRPSNRGHLQLRTNDVLWQDVRLREFSVVWLSLGRGEWRSEEIEALDSDSECLNDCFAEQVILWPVSGWKWGRQRWWFGSAF